MTSLFSMRLVLRSRRLQPQLLWLSRSSLGGTTWKRLDNVKERFYGKPDQASLLRVFLYSYFPTLVCLACQGIPGERIGYPFQYSWASLVAQLVKNPPAMRETWVLSQGWKIPLEEGAHSSILAWRIRMDRGAWQATLHRVTKSHT